jgi:hypothetical protein
MVKLKLFQRGFFFNRCTGTNCLSFSGAASSFLAARPLVAELGRAAGSGIEHLSNEVVLYRRSNKFADKFTHI